MFAIYNKGSVAFRSTIDNLYSLKKLDSPNNVRNETDGIVQDYNSYEKESSQKKITQQAINSYKKTANIDTRETIFHVHQIMSGNCISIGSKSTLQEVYYALKDNKVSQLPIIASSDKIIGMLDKKQILNFLMEDLQYATNIIEKQLDQINLPEIITTDPISDIRRVSKVMLDFNLSAIPVVNEYDILVGIVSKTDIIKAVSSIPHFQLWA